MLSKDEILSIIAQELGGSDYSSYDGSNQTDLESSMSYYLGLPNGTEVEGRSQVTSTDVADAIEWIMPQIMKSFTQNNEVVVFDPVHEGDEKQAEMESEYVYDVLMKQNDGFIILHQFIKDALMQRNGIIKVYYANRTETKLSDYTGITEQVLQQILSNPEVELESKSEYVDQEATAQKQAKVQQQLQMATQQAQQAMQQGQQVPPQAEQIVMQLQSELETPVMLYDVSVRVERIKGRIYVDSIPPEEFRLNSQHNSISLEKARFTAHVTNMTASEVIQEYGLSLKETEELPEGSSEFDREYRFSMTNESVFYEDNVSEDDSQRLIEVSECFLQLDVEETGISKLMKVTTAGGDSPSDLLLVEEIESMPWVSTTAFLMSHKWQGISITDRLKQIQDHKTALWRNMLDNMYLQNNQRNVVVEGQVNMDDLLVSRPGGIIRAKRTDAITPLITPQIGSDAFSMMEYLDRVRAGRTGVDADGSATPQAIGDRVGSQGVDRMMSAKEELVGLIIRVVAETGIKPLCLKIRDLAIKHVDSVTDFKFRGVWQQINPAQWSERTKCTIRVGTGSGNQMQKIQAVQFLMQMQEKLATIQSPLIDELRGFNALDDFCKFSGLNGATRYFVDPTSPEGQQKIQQAEQMKMQNQQKMDEMNAQMAQAQTKIAEAEMQKVQVQQQNNQLKAQIDTDKNQLTLQKQTTDAQLSSMKAQLDEYKTLVDVAGKTAELDQRKYEADQRTALELTRIENENEKELNANYEQNEDSVGE